MPDEAGYIRTSTRAVLVLRERSKEFQRLFSFDRTDWIPVCFSITGNPRLTAGCLTSIWRYDGLKNGYLWTVLRTAAQPRGRSIAFWEFLPFLLGEKWSLVKRDYDLQVCDLLNDWWLTTVVKVNSSTWWFNLWSEWPTSKILGSTAIINQGLPAEAPWLKKGQTRVRTRHEKKSLTSLPWSHQSALEKEVCCGELSGGCFHLQWHSQWPTDQVAYNSDEKYN